MEIPPPPPPCVRCNQPFADAEPTLTLLCGHREHTRCFFHSIVFQDITHISCGVCNTWVVPQDMIPDDDDDDDVEERHPQQQEDINDKLRTLYWDNAEFRKEVKEYVRLLKCLAKSKQAFTRAIKAKKTAIYTEMAGIRQQIEGLIQPQKAALRTSAEYKDYSRLKGRIQRKITKLATYNNLICHHTLRRALMRQRGLRVWPIYGWRYRRTSASLLYSSFYYRIKI